MGHQFFFYPKVMSEFIWWATACQEFFNIKNRTWRVDNTRSIFFPWLRFHDFFPPLFPVQELFLGDCSTTTFPLQKIMVRHVNYAK